MHELRVVTTGGGPRDGEAGHTLIELLAAMVIGSLLLTALMYVFVNGVHGSLRVADRTEATARARAALDRMTTLLDSQVCSVTTVNRADGTTGDESVPPVLPGSTGTSVTFYADLSGATDTPDKYTLSYDAAGRAILELRYRGTGTLPARTFPAGPSVRRMLADDVVPVGAQPVFRYFAFEPDGSVNPAKPLAVPLSAADAARTVRVAVTFQANPARTHTGDARRSVLEGAGTVATANPNDRTTCP